MSGVLAGPVPAEKTVIVGTEDAGLRRHGALEKVNIYDKATT
jgi:hypothetical protein